MTDELHYLSLVDSPGFRDLDAPDLEAYSKALNAGQYPLSILALTPESAALYRQGIYGNTMTANPRAMDIGSAVLGMVTPEVRQNIVDRGHEFVTKLEALADELGVDTPLARLALERLAPGLGMPHSALVSEENA